MRRRFASSTRRLRSRARASSGKRRAGSTYDLPTELIGQSWGGRYRGQKQKWFALRFDGKESEIDVLHPGGGKHKPEFSSWRWEKLERLPELIVPFKRDGL